MRASTLVIAGLVAALGGFVIGQLVGRGAMEDSSAALEAAGEVEGPPAGQQYRVVVGRSPQRGPDDAPVTIIEFVDYEAQGVADVQPVLEKVLRKYGRKVRLVIKQNPDMQHRLAMGAAEALLAANAQEKHWEMHRRLLENRDRLGRSDLEAHAKAVGLDLQQFREEMEEHEYGRLVASDMQIAARFGVRGSPVFFVNGYPLPGVQTFEAFERLVDRELPKAERLLRTGVPGNRLYAHVVRDARRSIGDEAARRRRSRRSDTVPASRVELPDTLYKVPIDGAPVKGPRGAVVTIVEYLDFQ